MNGAKVSFPVSGQLTDHIAIGVLSGLIHRDIVDDVLNECWKREERSRLLPAHVVVYYVLALNLFFGEAYEEVMRQLVNRLRFLGNWRQDWTVPSTSALSQARTRLGEAPLKLLFERLAMPMARAGARGVWLRGLRVMALDGLVFDVPDTSANDEEFGRGGNDQERSLPSGPPRRAVAECGTHALVDAVLGPVATGEPTTAGSWFGGRCEPIALLQFSGELLPRVGGAASQLSDHFCTVWGYVLQQRLPIFGLDRVRAQPTQHAPTGVGELQ
jgi:hypothetical protein